MVSYVTRVRCGHKVGLMRLGLKSSLAAKSQFRHEKSFVVVSFLIGMVHLVTVFGQGQLPTPQRVRNRQGQVIAVPLFSLLPMGATKTHVALQLSRPAWLMIPSIGIDSQIDSEDGIDIASAKAHLPLYVVASAKIGEGGNTLIGDSLLRPRLPALKNARLGDEVTVIDSYQKSRTFTIVRVNQTSIDNDQALDSRWANSLTIFTISPDGQRAVVVTAVLHEEPTPV